MTEHVPLPVAIPELRAFRTTTENVRAGVKENYVVARMERGTLEWWGRGKNWRSPPGSVLVKEPGDVHRDVSHAGTTVFTAVILPMREVQRFSETGKVFTLPHFEAGDPRAASFHRLHDAVNAGADRLTLEVAVAEAITSWSNLSDSLSHHTRPVRRATEYLRARLADSFTLDDVANYAALDKFHLCRAFRSQVGMPPHTYLTHLRVQRARNLLTSGVRASELAPRVGFYDQSQLTRHFKRIVGVTPGKYRNATSSPG
jgi:AraC-like DNA-binding protein